MFIYIYIYIYIYQMFRCFDKMPITIYVIYVYMKMYTIIYITSRNYFNILTKV